MSAEAWRDGFRSGMALASQARHDAAWRRGYEAGQADASVWIALHRQCLAAAAWCRRKSTWLAAAAIWVAGLGLWGTIVAGIL